MKYLTRLDGLEGEVRRLCSLVIPFHNGSRSFARAIASVYENTHLPSEIIVVDDGSHASEHKWLIEFCAGFEDISIVRTPNLGQSAARNLAVQNARFDNIIFLDQDDEYLGEHVRLYCDVLEDGSCDFVFSDYECFDEVIGSNSRNSINVSRSGEISLKHIIAHGSHIIPSALGIKKRTFLGLGGFKSYLRGFEDDDLILRLVDRDVRYRYLNQTLTRWKIHAGSGSYSPHFSFSRQQFLRDVVLTFGETRTYRTAIHFLAARVGVHTFLEEQHDTGNESNCDGKPVGSIVDYFFETLQIARLDRVMRLLNLLRLLNNKKFRPLVQFSLRCAAPLFAKNPVVDQRIKYWISANETVK